MSLSTLEHYLPIVYVYPRLHLCSFPQNYSLAKKKKKTEEKKKHKFEAILPCRPSSSYPYAIAKAHLPRQMAYLCLFIYIYSNYPIYLDTYRTFQYEMGLYTAYIQRRKQTPHHSAEIPSPPTPSPRRMQYDVVICWWYTNERWRLLERYILAYIFL